MPGVGLQSLAPGSPAHGRTRGEAATGGLAVYSAAEVLKAKPRRVD